MGDNITVPYLAGHFVDDHGTEVRYLGYGEEGYMAYGPYMYLPPGNYQVIYTIKQSSKSNNSVCTIDVYSLKTSNVTPISVKNIYSDALKEDVYNDVAVNFSSAGQDDLEFRVQKYNDSELWLSKIAVKPLADNLIIDLFNANTILFIMLFGIALVLVIFFSRILLKTGYVESLQNTRLLLILFIIVLIVYTGIILLSSYGVIPATIMTGDEPHYLIMTQSIIEDHDFLIQNNYENKQYLSFFPHDLSGDLDRQVVKDRWGDMVSIHGIGLPLLITVPFILGGVVGVRLFIAIVATIAVFLIFSMLNKLGFSRKIALTTTAVFAITSPLVFYSFSIYPDIFALTIGLVAINVLIDIQNGRNPPVWHLAASGLALAFLPWLGVKLGLLSIAFAIAFFYYYWARKIPFTGLLVVIIPVIVSALLFEGMLYYQFNSLNPVMIYSGLDENYGPNQVDHTGNGSFVTNMLNEIGSMFSMDPGHILNSFLARFVDGRYGILIYSPFLILMLIGLAVFAIRPKLAVNKKAVFIISLVLLPYLAMYVFTMSVGGATPPGRTLLPLIGIIAVFAAFGLEYMLEKGHIVSYILYAALSITIAAFMFLNPLTMYVHDLLAMLSPSILDLSRLFPSISFNNGLDLYPVMVTALWACIVLWPLLLKRLALPEVDAVRKAYLERIRSKK